jgi:uridine phosphorylase
MNGAMDGRLGRKMVVYESSVGAPAAAMIMETLVASGIKRVVLVGVAGSISSECRIGDVVVPTWGVREEGTSYHYVPGKVKVKASESLATAIGGHLGQGRFKEGGVWTVDAPYRETKGKIKKYSKQGVVAVDMESTALMAVAMCRKIEFAPVLVISDEAFGEKWVPEFHGPKVRRASEAVCRSVVELMSRS